MHKAILCVSHHEIVLYCRYIEEGSDLKLLFRPMKVKCSCLRREDALAYGLLRGIYLSS